MAASDADDLQRELLRLEARLGDATTPGTRGVIDELSRVRNDLGRRCDRPAPLRLAALRIASPCHQRWADMSGDDRVRVCNGCDRPVFNLSELTREEAEAVLATRGITPCVRFYRRADGTVMTADCPTGARRRLSVAAGALAAGGALLATSPATADPAPPATLSDAEFPELANVSPSTSTIPLPPMRSIRSAASSVGY